MSCAKLIIVLALLPVITATGQANMDQFAFDLTFWKKELRLSKLQQFEMHAVNINMYQALYQLAESDCIQSSDLEILMQLWKTSTLAILSDRQRKRLEKVKMKYRRKVNNKERIKSDLKTSRTTAIPYFRFS